MVKINRYLTGRSTGRPSTESAALARSYAAAGMESPTSIPAVLDRLAAEPHFDPLLAAMGAEIIDVEDPEAWLEDAIGRLHRAGLVRLLREHLPAAAERELRTHLGDYRRQAFTDLHPFLVEAVDEFAETACTLPLAPLTLDAGAAVAAGVGAELRAVGDQLERIGALLSFLPVHNGNDQGARLPQVALDLLDFADCEVAQVTERGGDPLEDDPVRDGIRAVREQIRAHDLDAALVSVARGEHHGVSLQLIDEPGERAERLERFVQAFRVEVVSLPRHWAKVG